MKILIADDSLTIRKLLESYLTDWGYEITSAANGSEAWNLLQQPDAPLLVILDWLMPGIDGIEVCRRVRQLENGKLFHIIILTSLDAKGNLIAALEAGADDFISKRFDADEFQARIKVGERIVSLKSELASRIRELEQAASQIKRLQGILPICMYCHKIRSESEVWENLEKYISENTDAMLSHGLCPDCLKEHYPELAAKKISKKKTNNI